ncbi:MAG: glycosyltransferase [Caldisphaera sp.]
MLSKSNDVTVITWGEGDSNILIDGRMKIIHYGRKRKEFLTNNVNIYPRFLVDLISYLGIYNIISLRNKGPSPRDILKEIDNKFDIIMRISFDNNEIPRYLGKYFDIPVVELAIVAGLPHYLQNVKAWTKYNASISPLSVGILNFFFKISKMIVLKFFVSSLSSRNVLVVSQRDLLEMRKIKNLKISYIPPLHNFSCKETNIYDNRIVIFFSSRNLAAQIAGEFIAKAATTLNDIEFAITGFKPEITSFTELPSNLILYGYLDESSFNDLLDKSSIVIFPLISGQGFQTKMGEALARGKPIITTSVIAEEFPELNNGEHILIEDNPEEFIKKIKLLMNDRDLRIFLSNNAQKYYKNHLSMDIALQRHLEYLESVINNHNK